MEAYDPSQKPKVKGRVSSTLQIIIGSFISILFGLPALFGGQELRREADPGVYSSIVLLFGLGLFLLIMGIRRKRLIKLYHLYSARLSVDPLGSLELLAGSLGTSVDLVRTNLLRLLKKGYFPGAFLDSTGKRLVLPGAAPPAPVRSCVQSESAVVVRCGSCGAANRIPEGRTPAECEYCGAPLK